MFSNHKAVHFYEMSFYCSQFFIVVRFVGVKRNYFPVLTVNYLSAIRLFLSF